MLSRDQGLTSSGGVKEQEVMGQWVDGGAVVIPRKVKFGGKVTDSIEI